MRSYVGKLGEKHGGAYRDYAVAVEDYLTRQDARLHFWALRIYLHIAYWKGAITDEQHALLVERTVEVRS